MVHEINKEGKIVQLDDLSVPVEVEVASCTFVLLLYKANEHYLSFGDLVIKGAFKCLYLFSGRKYLRSQWCVRL